MWVDRLGALGVVDRPVANSAWVCQLNDRQSDGKIKERPPETPRESGRDRHIDR